MNSDIQQQDPAPRCREDDYAIQQRVPAPRRREDDYNIQQYPALSPSLPTSLPPFPSLPLSFFLSLPSLPLSPSLPSLPPSPLPLWSMGK